MAGSLTRHLVTALIVLVVAAGCAPDPELLTSDVEAAVADSLLPVVVAGLDCTDVARLDPASGGSFGCAGMVDGDAVDVDGALAPMSETTIDIEVVLATALLDVAAVETNAAIRLDADLGDSPSVTCPVSFVVISVGRQFTCRVDRVSGTSQDIAITIVDGDGNWEINPFP